MKGVCETHVSLWSKHAMPSKVKTHFVLPFASSFWDFGLLRLSTGGRRGRSRV